MGKDATEERERGASRRRGRPTQGVADWATANGDLLIRAVCAASVTGGALRFGYSRDGGAYAIGVYGDGEPYTDFVSSSENIDDALNYYVELFADQGGSPTNSVNAQKGEKRAKKDA